MERADAGYGAQPAYEPHEYAELERRVFAEEQARLNMQPDEQVKSARGGYTITRRQVIEDQYKIESADGGELPLSALGEIGGLGYGYDQASYRQLDSGPAYGYADDESYAGYEDQGGVDDYGYGQPRDYGADLSLQDSGQLYRPESGVRHLGAAPSRVIDMRTEEPENLSDEIFTDSESRGTAERKGFRMPSKRARLAAAWMITAGLGVFSATHFDQLGNATYHIFYEHFDTDFQSVRAAFNGVEVSDQDIATDKEAEEIKNGEE